MTRAKGRWPKLDPDQAGQDRAGAQREDSYRRPTSRGASAEHIHNDCR